MPNAIKKSHFDKPISEITMEEVDRMSKEDLAEDIIEHPWLEPNMTNEDKMSLRKIWTYTSMMKWVHRWCDELSKRGSE
jgi:hypothetical protein